MWRAHQGTARRRKCHVLSHHIASLPDCPNRGERQLVLKPFKRPAAIASQIGSRERDIREASGAWIAQVGITGVRLARAGPSIQVVGRCLPPGQIIHNHSEILRRRSRSSRAGRIPWHRRLPDEGRRVP